MKDEVANAELFRKTCAAAKVPHEAKSVSFARSLRIVRFRQSPVTVVARMCV